MLDRTSKITLPAETQSPGARSPYADGVMRANWLQRLAGGRLVQGVQNLARRAWLFFVRQSFSSLTRRIVFLNVAGLVALVVGILELSQLRAGLIEVRIHSLEVQGEIIASAIAAAATTDSDNQFFDRDRPLELKLDEGDAAFDEGIAGLEFSINPERVAPQIHRLISPTRTYARVYDRDGFLILDSRNVYLPGEIRGFELPPPNEERPGIFKRAWNALRAWLDRGDLPLYRELGPTAGKDYPEVAQALAGNKASMVRVNERGEVIVSVAVPVQRFRAVRGALLLTTQGGDIDAAVANERLMIIKVFLIATVVMVVLSVLLAGTIAGPVRRLAEAAERVRRRIRARIEIPDLTARRDEIGHLSGALRDMTNALYSRIEAIESFAADVAHELKNPLTSLRSAVETLPLAKTAESRARLLAVIQHDVKRIDRLISDISDASRLDAELQRQESAPVDLAKLLAAVVTAHNEMRQDNGVRVSLTCEEDKPCVVVGNDSRLGQVVNNLLDNARSFSPPGGTVRVTCRRLKDEVEIAVDDDGPGIRPDALEKIFQRFYTDRPHQGFGQNSGLGLSISKQIVEAHGGRLWAENRTAPSATGEPRVLGARFVVRLPAA